jgi:hypothetical protein
MSCCPTENALLQKQTVTPPLAVQLFAPIIAWVDENTMLIPNGMDAETPLPPHSGRDLLRKVHLLRI